MAMKQRYYDTATGRLYDRHTGCITLVRVWTGQMLGDLRRWYATTTNDELAALLGVSRCSVQRKAKQLGLKKDAGWLRKLRHQSLTWARIRNNKLGRGRFQPGNRIGAANWFKCAQA